MRNEKTRLFGLRTLPRSPRERTIAYDFSRDYLQKKLQAARVKDREPIMTSQGIYNRRPG
jgi:hypothetical protein